MYFWLLMGFVNKWIIKYFKLRPKEHTSVSPLFGCHRSDVVLQCRLRKKKQKKRNPRPICRECVGEQTPPTDKVSELDRSLVLTPRLAKRHSGVRVKRGGLLWKQVREKSKCFGQTWPGETSGRAQMLTHTDWGAGITRQDPLWSWADILNAPSRKVLYPVARFPTDRSLSLFVSFS